MALKLKDLPSLVFHLTSMAYFSFWRMNLFLKVKHLLFYSDHEIRPIYLPRHILFLTKAGVREEMKLARWAYEINAWGAHPKDPSQIEKWYRFIWEEGIRWSFCSSSSAFLNTQSFSMMPLSISFPQRQDFSLFFFLFCDWSVLLIFFLLSWRILVVPPYHSIIFWLFAQSRNLNERMEALFNLHNLKGIQWA